MQPRDLPDDSFATIAVALFQESRHYAESNLRLEQLAERLAIAGLAEDTRERILADAIKQAALIEAAHRWFRALCPHEEKIREIVSNDQVEKAA